MQERGAAWRTPQSVPSLLPNACQACACPSPGSAQRVASQDEAGQTAWQETCVHGPWGIPACFVASSVRMLLYLGKNGFLRWIITVNYTSLILHLLLFLRLCLMKWGNEVMHKSHPLAWKALCCFSLTPKSLGESFPFKITGWLPLWQASSSTSHKSTLGGGEKHGTHNTWGSGAPAPPPGRAGASASCLLAGVAGKCPWPQQGLQPGTEGGHLPALPLLPMQDTRLCPLETQWPSRPEDTFQGSSAVPRTPHPVPLGVPSVPAGPGAQHSRV